MLNFIRKLLTKNKQKREYEQYLTIEYKIAPESVRKKRNESRFSGIGHIGYDGQRYKKTRRSVDKVLET